MPARAIPGVFKTNNNAGQPRFKWGGVVVVDVLTDCIIPRGLLEEATLTLSLSVEGSRAGPGSQGRGWSSVE